MYSDTGEAFKAGAPKLPLVPVLQEWNQVLSHAPLGREIIGSMVIIAENKVPSGTVWTRIMTV